jgi:hypothetical protein
MAAANAGMRESQTFRERPEVSSAESSVGSFKGYFDESGKEEDPQFADSAISVGGWVTTVDSWRDLEAKWSAVLARAEFDVPYLHMKEFAHSEPRTPFESWKGDEPRRSAFMAALTDVIRDSDLAGVGAIVRVPDLQRFNREHSQNLQAYPLGMYGALIELSRRYEGVRVETVWDRVNRHATQVAMAREYAATDRETPNCGRNVQIAPLEGDLSAKDVPALQMADFAAYELLKSHRDKNDWFKSEEPFLKPMEWFKSQFNWTLSRALANRRTTSWPDERKSYLALFGAPIMGPRPARPMEGRTWTYNAILHCHCVRRGIWREDALPDRSS